MTQSKKIIDTRAKLRKILKSLDGTGITCAMLIGEGDHISVGVNGRAKNVGAMFGLALSSTRDYYLGFSAFEGKEFLDGFMHGISTEGKVIND